MAWSTPKTWTTGAVLSKADLDEQVRDNTTYLHTGKPMSITTVATGGPYSTASGSLADVDSTNLTVTLSLTTGRAIVMCTCSCYGDAAARLITFAVEVDSTAVYIGKEVVDTTARLVSFMLPVTGLSVGSHTFTLQWKVGSGTAYMFSDTEGLVRFTAAEW